MPGRRPRRMTRVGRARLTRSYGSNRETPDRDIGRVSALVFRIALGNAHRRRLASARSHDVFHALANAVVAQNLERLFAEDLHRFLLGINDIRTGAEGA